MTDNVRSQPEGGDVRADGFGTAQGHLLLNYVGALSREEAAYSVVALSYLRGAASPMLTQTLRLSSAIDASPGLLIGFSAGATMTQLTMVDTFSPADPHNAGPRPAGDQTFVSLEASQSLAYEWSGSWRLSQALAGYLFHPLGSESTVGDTRGLTLDAAVHRLWAQDQAGLSARLGATTASGTAVTASRSGQFAQLQLVWRHEWTPAVSHELGAGVTAARSDRVRLLPSGSAAVIWRGTGRDLEIRAARTAESSMYVGTIYERSVVGLRVGLLLDRLETLGLVAAVDVEHDSALPDSAGQGGSANVFFTRAALNWRPGEMFEYGIEYSFRDQRASAPATSVTTMRSFRRQMAIVSVGIRFPDDRR